MARKEQLSLGGRLRSWREELGFDIRETSFLSHVAPHVIEALENDDYQKFTAKIYAIGALEKLLKTLSRQGEAGFIQEFSNEWDIAAYRVKNQHQTLPSSPARRPYFTPRSLTLAVLIIAAAALLFFLGSRLLGFLDDPELVIKEPRERAVVSRQPTALLKGTVEKESQLTVNGKEIKVDAEGNFEDKMELAAGVNELKFLVRDRFGKERNEIRYVVVK